MRKGNVTILASIFIMALVAAGVGAGTMAYFSDVEKSTGNVFTAGTIDIAVDDQNPWTETYSAVLSDVKPCETREITFVITNLGNNPVMVWKKLTVTGCSGGIVAYGPASSEPEYTECGGQFDSGVPTGLGYVESCWLPPYIEYQLGGSFSEGFRWATINEVKGKWQWIDVIEVEGSRTVIGRYHMYGDTGNWAQGDTMTFDIELYAEQVGGPGPSGPGIDLSPH